MTRPINAILLLVVSSGVLTCGSVETGAEVSVPRAPPVKEASTTVEEEPDYDDGCAPLRSQEEEANWDDFFRRMAAGEVPVDDATPKPLSPEMQRIVDRHKVEQWVIDRGGSITIDGEQITSVFAPDGAHIVEHTDGRVTATTVEHPYGPREWFFVIGTGRIASTYKRDSLQGKVVTTVSLEDRDHDGVTDEKTERIEDQATQRYSETTTTFETDDDGTRVAYVHRSRGCMGQDYW